ncbi:DUF4340 domain-containing protein [Reichenbachiella carrageenanivorans]|uniref:DUF4340 domain-containing protein n=1 Tax=Reichenbachiella carrageenanivorans TaxID=2979869 RepID=A0ABY6D302_9BACT|nr:DUF4340 domain-containing protein [Reichenbachiella carrageenanivorans]UXX78215.1 DUF4340 domain-containing protein [Reichenbachiella carrageenanivorans]
MKKLSNIKLISVLVALCLIYFVVDFTGGKSKSKSLKSELVSIDTAKVTQIYVDGARGKQVQLDRVQGEWELTLPNDKKVLASPSAVDNALFALNSIKPSRIATKSEAKWKDYQVDSTGTRVKVFEGGDQTLDLVIGRFGMEGQRAYHTYVRLYDDKEVYVAKDFMGFSVSADPSAYRDQVLARINKDSVASITFNYQADSSFRLERVGTAWQVNGEPADSAVVAKYLGGLNYVSGKEYMDEENKLTVPVMSAAVDMNDGYTVLFDGYQLEDEWVFHSSTNESGYFKDMAILDKVFVGKSELK